MEEKTEILFTVDFPADMEPDDVCFAGWGKFVEMSFDKRDDFRAVVNFQGEALRRLLEDGERVEKLRQLVSDKHIFAGNNSWSLRSFTGDFQEPKVMTRAEQADDLLRAQEFITENLAEPIFFRAPFFDHNDDTLQLVRQLGLRYDLSGYITDDDYHPVVPYEYFLTGNEVLVRVDTNLRLTPYMWKENIRSWKGQELEPGLHCVMVHPHEFSAGHEKDDVIPAMERMMELDCVFAGPSEIFSRLCNKE